MILTGIKRARLALKTLFWFACFSSLGTPLLAQESIYIRCEYTEILDRIDNNGSFPREALPDCFPSDFDMMCKRVGVRFFKIDEKHKNFYATLHSGEDLLSKGGYDWDEDAPYIIFGGFYNPDVLQTSYRFNRVTGEFLAIEIHEREPKHSILQTGECKKILPGKKF